MWREWKLEVEGVDGVDGVESPTFRGKEKHMILFIFTILYYNKTKLEKN